MRDVKCGYFIANVRWWLIAASQLPAVRSQPPAAIAK